jgi:ubiquinone/menaquinone biosynthesis C-methylase UbiE
MGNYKNIRPSGGSTGAKRNLERRFALMQRFVDLKDKTILDMGCGNGRYVLKFLEFSPHVQGIEFSDTAVQEYRRDAARPEIVEQGNIEKLTFEDNRFDVVLLNEVLEHVSDDGAAIREAWRVLKPDAWLVVFSPNRLYPFETHGVRLTKTGRELPHYFPFVPYIPLSIGHRFLTYHARNYFPWVLKRMIRDQSFEVTAQTCTWQTFENISGNAPHLVIALSPLLRSISFVLEKIPLIKFFGTSQVILAQKKD